jgi:separase
MATLQAALENLFRHHLICSQDKTVYNRPLDEHIISCFVSLPIDCRDEDLEDLIQFVVDSYQIHEAPVVGDEVDVDQASFFSFFLDLSSTIDIFLYLLIFRFQKKTS